VAVAEKEKKELKKRIALLPDACGVYIFKDSRGNILYIGKAGSLKKRVQSYFSRRLSSKNQALVFKIEDLEYVLSPSESRAELLEASLIKAHRPPYNISLKDDKSFPLIKITSGEFPLVSLCRRKNKGAEDASLYFGPYTNAGLLRQALASLRRIFGFRSCKIMPKQACLYYRLNLCPAPCAGKITPARYAEIIKDIKMFLESRNEELLARLYLKMEKASLKQNFEEAVRSRDQISALASILEGGEQCLAVGELEGLKGLIGLKKIPERIEAFDISNISGAQATGSMVSFYKGKADKNNYRRFRIKTVSGIDDYGMLREVLRRRYSRLIVELALMPDLIIIDGGKAHLQVALGVIKSLGLDIPLISMAKDRENIYVTDRDKPIKLEADIPALNLIRRIRDEAHRFAIKYHHLLRKKKTLG
jgi:excinuclease ABC subunit C